MSGVLLLFLFSAGVWESGRIREEVGVGSMRVCLCVRALGPRSPGRGDSFSIRIVACDAWWTFMSTPFDLHWSIQHISLSILCRGCRMNALLRWEKEHWCLGVRAGKLTILVYYIQFPRSSTVSGRF